jgi:hypothetical protein
MLHRNMNTLAVRLGLDDLLADLKHARRTDDLGRLALIAYCEVRRWARSAGQPVLAGQVSKLVLDSPQPTREAFLAEVDRLIDTLELMRLGAVTAPAAPAPAAAGRPRGVSR